MYEEGDILLDTALNIKRKVCYKIESASRNIDRLVIQKDGQ